MTGMLARAWRSALIALSVLLFASSAHADPFNGFLIQHDPVCAGQETPANQVAWRMIQQYRAAFPRIPSWAQVLAQVKEPLESAAEAGDSWASYELGILVYPIESGLYARDIPDMTKRTSEIQRYAQLRDAAVLKAAIGGNCEAALWTANQASSSIGNVLYNDRNYTIDRRYDQAQQLINIAKLDLANAKIWCDKAVAAFPPEDEADIAFFSGCRKLIDYEAQQIAYNQKTLDDADGDTAREQARIAAADPKVQAQRRAELASQQAEEEGYRRDVANFDESKKIKKKIGDDVCEYVMNIDLRCGYVDRVVNGRVEIIFKHEGVVGETVYGQSAYGGSYVISSTPGVAPSETHEFRDEYAVGMHDRVTFRMAWYPMKQVLGAFGALLSGPLQKAVAPPNP